MAAAGGVSFKVDDDVKEKLTKLCEEKNMGVRALFEEMLESYTARCQIEALPDKKELEQIQHLLNRVMDIATGVAKSRTDAELYSKTLAEQYDAQVKNLEAEIAAHLKREKTFESDIEKLVAEQTIKDDRYEELSSTLKQALQEQKQIVDDYKKRIEALERELAEVKGDKGRVSSELLELKSASDPIKQEYEKIKYQYETLKHDFDEKYQNAQTAHENEITTLKLQHHQAVLNAKSTELEKIEELQNRVEELRDERATLQQEVSKQQAQLKA